jgi:hypothetical protein
MIGYGPAAEGIRAERGLPYATGADDPDVRNPPAGHDHPFQGASDVGLPAGAVYGPAPDAAVTVTPEWWRP